MRFITLINGIRTARLVDELDQTNLETDAPLTVPGGRLTLDTNDPVGGLLAPGLSSVSVLRYIPYVSNYVPIFSNTANRWRYTQISAGGLALTLTSNPAGVYDVFLNSSAALTLQSWSNDTTRSVALTRRNGLWTALFSGGTDRRLYLGTICTTGAAGSGVCHDNSGRRFVWNAYNRVPKFLRQLEVASSWTFNSATARPWNNSTANRVEVVCGEASSVDLSFTSRIESPGAVGGLIALAVNSTTTAVDYVYAVDYAGDLNLRYCGAVTAGFHYFQALEAAFGGTVTFRGDTVYGLKGTWVC